MLNKYEVFVQVAETRNLTKVAERYHYSQSAISHALRALEEEIGPVSYTHLERPRNRKR